MTYLTFIRDRINSLHHAFNGIRFAIKSETHIQLHLIATIAVGAIGYYFKFTTTEWLIVITCICIVISVEILNTAIELLCNFIHPKHHPKIGRIKDLSAGAVLICSVASAIIGAYILFNHLQ